VSQNSEVDLNDEDFDGTSFRDGLEDGFSEIPELEEPTPDQSQPADA